MLQDVCMHGFVQHDVESLRYSCFLLRTSTGTFGHSFVSTRFHLAFIFILPLLLYFILFFLLFLGVSYAAGYTAAAVA